MQSREKRNQRAAKKHEWDAQAGILDDLPSARHGAVTARRFDDYDDRYSLLMRNHPARGRHGRGALISDLVRHRVVTGISALAAVGVSLESWSSRHNPELAMFLLGFGIFMTAVTVTVGSQSIGPRPLRSFGVGAWLFVMGLGALLAWLNRGAIDSTRPLLFPMMLLLAVGLPPLGAWMMIRRPEQTWEKEVRLDRE